ncbi:MAG: VWA domain-containing protein, partial [Lachnospiraceae bacterium]|nr:VWA domain-containing protein [Lachnospiraceae bacterium]
MKGIRLRKNIARILAVMMLSASAAASFSNVQVFASDDAPAETTVPAETPAPAMTVSYNITEVKVEQVGNVDGSNTDGDVTGDGSNDDANGNGNVDGTNADGDGTGNSGDGSNDDANGNGNVDGTNADSGATGNSGDGTSGTDSGNSGASDSSNSGASDSISGTSDSGNSGASDSSNTGASAADGGNSADAADSGSSTEADEPAETEPRDPFQNDQGENLKWEVKTGQTVVSNEAEPGTYLLTISVTATATPAGDETTTPVTVGTYDIVFIVDESGSMVSRVKDNEGNYTDETRMDVAKNALKKMINEVAGSDNAQIAIIGFSTYAKRYTEGFTGDKEELLKAVDRLEPAGLTNLHEGLEEAEQMLIAVKDKSSNKIVVAICDGGLGSSEKPSNETLENMTGFGKEGDRFYSVGFGTTNKTLQDLIKHVPGEAKGEYMQAQAATLADVIQTITKTVQKGEYNFVLGGELQTTLSEAVDFANNSFSLTIRDKDGNPVKDADGNELTLAQGDKEGEWILPETKMNKASRVKVELVQKEDGTEQLRLVFPANYQLEDGWSYLAEAVIKINEEFAAVYTGQIDGKGEAETGTHAGEEGVWSNSHELSLTHFS